MAKYMDDNEFKRYVAVVLEEIGKRRQKQGDSDAAELILADDSKKYTLDDVVSAISQVSPEDAKLAYEVIDDIELRLRPNALLTSVQDKVKLHENIKSARYSLSAKSAYASILGLESKIDTLVDEDIFDGDEADKYISEMNLLNLVLKNEISQEAKEKGVREKGRNTYFYSWLLMEATASAGFFAAFSTATAITLSTLSALVTGISAVYISEIAEKKLAKSNEQKAREAMKSFEENFGYRLYGIETLAKKFLEHLESDNLIIKDLGNEEKIIQSISLLQSHFKSLLHEIPKIKGSYKALKEAESGLPVENYKLLESETNKKKL